MFKYYYNKWTEPVNESAPGFVYILSLITRNREPCNFFANFVCNADKPFLVVFDGVIADELVLMCPLLLVLILFVVLVFLLLIC